jgi:hypothetical protein
MAGTTIPFLPPQFFTAAGAVAAGHKLFAYAAGTTTKLDTFTDVDLTTANTNPIVLSSAGVATIFLSAASYKFVLAPPTDTDPPTSPIWTRDNVLAVPGFATNVDVAGTASSSMGYGDPAYLSDGSGSLTAGRWYEPDSDDAYASIAAKVIGFQVGASFLDTGESGTFRILGRVPGLTGLTIGTTYYVGSDSALTATPPANARAFGVADSTTSLIIAPGVTKFENYRRSTAVGNATTVETDIATYTVPGTTLFADGQEFILETGGHLAANANTKTVKLYFAGTLLHTFATTISGGSWRASIRVIRRSATSVVEHTNVVIGGASTYNTATAVAVAFQNEQIWDSHTPTLASDNIIKVTGTSGTATDDIISDWARGYRPPG